MQLLPEERILSQLEVLRVRILYIATSFPTPEAGATIYTDLAEALVAAGHELTVVVSEQPSKQRTTGVTCERGFDVLRIVTGKYYDVGFVRKGFTAFLIPFLLRHGIDKHLKYRNFDVVLFESPPVTTGSLVGWLKARFGCRSYLMLKDIFPQNAVDLSIIRKYSPIYYYFRFLAKAQYKVADIIGCMSVANVEYVRLHNIQLPASKVELFPNTKKLKPYTVSYNSALRHSFAIPANARVFLMGGNIGPPQYVDLLCKVVVACKNDDDIFFLFVGRGTSRNQLEKTIKEEGITNARVLPNMPRHEYEQILAMSDIGLLTLHPGFTIPNYPSRILSYLEQAKPVLAATDLCSDIRTLIEEAQCGRWVWSGDLHAVVMAIREMAANDNLAGQGSNGRTYMEQNFAVERSVKILERHFALKEQRDDV